MAACEFHQLLSNTRHTEKIYRALEHDDVSEVIMTALDILKKTGKMPCIRKEPKDAMASILARELGNENYKNNLIQAALNAYNMAILLAPKGSGEMMLAYSNRSALFLKAKCYAACLHDLETCVKLGCTEDVIKKINKRRKECEEFLWQDNLRDMNCKSIGNYFEFNVERHPEIPCASKDIEIVIGDNKIPKVVAARNIKVGTVVAVEKPFVAAIVNDMYSTCYYCHKICLNLFPCDRCTYAMFCREICMEQCMMEYHYTECQVIDVSVRVFTECTAKLAFKAALKIRQMSKSWKELIEASHNIGQDGMEKASVNAIFDENNKFSLLSFDESHIRMIHGRLYNICFEFATIIHSLDEISYFPKTPKEKDAAMRAFARILVRPFLSLQSLILYQTAENRTLDIIGNSKQLMVYWLSFASRLRHCCEANIVPQPLHNKVALVAQRPIKKGAELNISYIDHWVEMSYQDKLHRARNLYRVTKGLCDCKVCSECWGLHNVEAPNLSAATRKCFVRWKSSRENGLTPFHRPSFRWTCETMAKFDQDEGNSHELFELITEFRKTLNIYQFAATMNVIIGEPQ